jgi:superfamily II DNA helicase RecQ
MYSSSWLDSLHHLFHLNAASNYEHGHVNAQNGAHKTISIELTTNRPNLVYAVIPMIGTVTNFSDFLLPPSFPPNFVLLQKSIVFFDNKRKSPALAAHLNSKLPAVLAAKEPFRVYHSSMSKPYSTSRPLPLVSRAQMVK